MCEGSPCYLCLSLVSIVWYCMARTQEREFHSAETKHLHVGAMVPPPARVLYPLQKASSPDCTIPIRHDTARPQPEKRNQSAPTSCAPKPSPTHPMHTEGAYSSAIQVRGTSYFFTPVHTAVLTVCDTDGHYTTAIIGRHEAGDRPTLRPSITTNGPMSFGLHTTIPLARALVFVSSASFQTSLCCA